MQALRKQTLFQTLKRLNEIKEYYERKAYCFGLDRKNGKTSLLCCPFGVVRIMDQYPIKIGLLNLIARIDEIDLAKNRCSIHHEFSNTWAAEVADYLMDRELATSLLMDYDNPKDTALTLAMVMREFTSTTTDTYVLGIPTQLRMTQLMAACILFQVSIQKLAISNQVQHVYPLLPVLLDDMIHLLKRRIKVVTFGSYSEFSSLRFVAKKYCNPLRDFIQNILLHCNKIEKIRLIKFDTLDWDSLPTKLTYLQNIGLYFDIPASIKIYQEKIRKRLCTQSLNCCAFSFKLPELFEPSHIFNRIQVLKCLENLISLKYVSFQFDLDYCSGAKLDESFINRIFQDLKDVKPFELERFPQNIEIIRLILNVRFQSQYDLPGKCPPGIHYYFNALFSRSVQNTVRKLIIHSNVMAEYYQNNDIEFNFCKFFPRLEILLIQFDNLGQIEEELSVQKFEYFDPLPKLLRQPMPNLKCLTLKKLRSFGSFPNIISEHFPNLIELNLSVVDPSQYEFTLNDTTLVELIQKIKSLRCIRFLDAFSESRFFLESMKAMASRALEHKEKCIFHLPISTRWKSFISRRYKITWINFFFFITNGNRWIYLF